MKIPFHSSICCPIFFVCNLLSSWVGMVVPLLQGYTAVTTTFYFGLYLNLLSSAGLMLLRCDDVVALDAIGKGSMYHTKLESLLC